MDVAQGDDPKLSRIESPGDILSIDQIQARYAPDWVLIDQPDIDDMQRLHAGRVVFHSPDRDEVYRKAIELASSSFAVRYLGGWPDDCEFSLTPRFFFEAAGTCPSDFDSSPFALDNDGTEASPMSDMLPIGEMQTRYPSEWVLIGDPQTDDYQRLLAGRVLFHSPDRDAVDRKLLELRPTRYAFRYLGDIADDLVFVL